MIQFLELLRIALGRESGFSQMPSAIEWEHLFASAKKQALVGITYAAIERLPREQRPPRYILLQWGISATKIKELNANLNRQIKFILKRFQHAGFGTSVLKGQAIAQYYAIDRLDGLRTPGDWDLWLDGSRDEIIDYARQYDPNGVVVYHHVDFPRIDGVEVEAHFTPSWMNNYFTNRALQRFFKQSKKEQFDVAREQNDAIPMPTLSFNRIYVLVHIYRHLFHTGIGFRQMLDYYYVLRQGFSQEERTEAMRILSRLKMKRFAQAAMWVLQYVFGLEDEYLITEPNEKEGRFLLNEILLAGNFGMSDERMMRTSEDTDFIWGLRKVKRNFRFLWSYPSEVLWSPMFKLWHYFWRKQYVRST